MMVNGGIKKGGLFNSKVYPYGVYSLRVKSSKLLCVWCGKWVHSRHARVHMVTPKFSRNFTCRKCDGNIEKTAYHVAVM